MFSALFLFALTFSAPTAGAVEAVQNEAPLAPIAQRLKNVSDHFVGAPYAHSPLGEGSGEDSDPRIRFDRFDCTTFVETVIALAHTKTQKDALLELDAIRYKKGEVSFLTRRHFPQAEWIPELVAKGVLEDVTKKIAGRDAFDAPKKLTPETWQKRKNKKGLQLPNERIPNGTFHLDYWPLDFARAKQSQIPAGTILNIVRIDYKSVPVRVTHQGLVIEKKGKLYFRHAADRMYHSVTDEPLDRFFYRMQQYKKWPVVGVNMLKVLDRRSSTFDTPLQ